MWLLVLESYVMTSGMALFADVLHLLWPMACGIRGPVSSELLPSIARNSTENNVRRYQNGIWLPKKINKSRNNVLQKLKTIIIVFIKKLNVSIFYHLQY